MPETNPPGGNAAPENVTPQPAPKKPRLVWLKRLALLAVAGAIVAGGGLAGAEYYTARPQFCGSCHVMIPYYKSWSHDIHGAKVNAACIDCHYAPGERETIRAKFRGLSQVASYVSGRYGSSRPRAQVSDASCLVSPCHGDHKFESKMLLIGKPRSEKRHIGDKEVEVQRAPSVHFYHDKHLKTDDKFKEVNEKRDAALAQLAAALTPDGVQKVKKVALTVSSANERIKALAKLATDLAMSEPTRLAAINLTDAEHRLTRVKQLQGMACSSCHNFNPDGTSHISVDRAACYTCHFTNESFNHGTGECLKCHEPPARSIMIHTPSTNSDEQPVLMDHQDIVRRGVDCASCHYDTIRGDAKVLERACTHCHDQAQFLEEFGQRTQETVRKYHAIHVAEKRAHCVDCHHAIEHNLADPERLTTGAGFLEPVRNDCAHCHPNHHSEQVSLLTGSGGALLTQETPNSMLGSRLNCRGCHTQAAADAKGDDLIRASEASCLACHTNDYAKLFGQWKSELGTYTQELESQIKELEARVAALPADKVPPRVTELLAAVKKNYHLVHAGDGIHNRHYALQLIDAARNGVAEANAKLQ